jgi:arsenate reductase
MTDSSVAPAAKPPIRVLFVCTGNSARSQMAEALLQRFGEGAFETYSAGTQPRGVHPLTIRSLAEVGIDMSGARSKSVQAFAGQRFDYVVTVCDRAREACPVFPGAGDALHWDFDDPAEVTGTEAERLLIFRRVLGQISIRLRTFIPVALRERDHRPSPLDTA